MRLPVVSKPRSALPEETNEVLDQNMDGYPRVAVGHDAVL